MLEKSGIPLASIKLFQVNLPAKHIAESVIEEFQQAGMEPAAFYTKLDEVGYSGPPMALICLDRIVREESFNRSDRIASFVTEVSKFMQAGYVIKYHGTDR
jgi:3-oxoacyl-[acyl-carrier-protein] synthase III